MRGARRIPSAAARDNGRRVAPSRRAPGPSSSQPRGAAAPACRARRAGSRARRRLRCADARSSASRARYGGQRAIGAFRQRRGRETRRSRSSSRCLQQRMVRDTRLWISTSPGLLPRPARPATCTMVCARRSAARKSVLNRPWSAFSTTDQRDVREVVALGHHLRADQDARLAAARRGRLRPRRSPRRAQHVAVEALDARRRDSARAASPRRARCPGPRASRRSRSAGSSPAAAPRRRSDGSAAARVAMHGQPRIALGAAARSSRSRRRPASAHSRAG